MPPSCFSRRARRRVATIAALILPIAWAASGRLVHAEDRTAWMQEARWGVMVHYLADWRAQVDGGKTTVESWNATIDQFDADGLAEQVASCGAGYLLLTIGQNSGYYLSPNATYDKLVGRAPSRCSTRDLPADMHEALCRRGVRLLVYLPSGPPGGDSVARKALGFEGDGRRNREFQLHWEAVIREWSLRWGDKVSGWWFDGCYWPNLTYRHDEPPNFESFAAAARAGNPEAVVAFNPGVVDRVLSITPFEDYSAGEINDLDRLMIRRHKNGKVDGAQIHVLSYLGDTWGKGAPRFSAAQIVRWTRQVVDAKGAMTWDVPVQRGGLMTPEYMEQLKAIGAAVPANETRR